MIRRRERDKGVFSRYRPINVFFATLKPESIFCNCLSDCLSQFYDPLLKRFVSGQWVMEELSIFFQTYIGLEWFIYANLVLLVIQGRLDTNNQDGLDIMCLFIIVGNLRAVV